VQTRIPVSKLPATSAFMRDYATPSGFAKVAQWFHYNPHDPGCFSARLAELESLPAAAQSQRATLASALAEQQQRWGGHLPDGNAASIAAARSLVDSKTYAVVTGQQVGLFGGPMYTQFKAISAIKLARQLEAEQPGYRFVPMFWMASSDHDFEEVRRSFTLDRNGEVRELALPPEGEAEVGKVIAQRSFGAELDELLGQLEEALPGGEQRADVIEALRVDYGAVSGRSGALVEGFARWMARLFAGSGLVLVDPQHPVLMRAALPLLRRELEIAAESEAALIARNTAIRAAGYPLQVEHLAGDTNLFLLDAQGRRQKISLSSGANLAPSAAGGSRPAPAFVLRGSAAQLSLGELLAIAETTPERLVPGVMLRPLHQNMLIPPIAFVGGAAEIAYRAQTSAVFDQHSVARGGPGFAMAPAFLRNTLTLLPRKSAELFDELGWDLADTYALPQELAGRAVSADRPEEVQAAVDEYLAALQGAEARLKALAVKLDPNLEVTFDTLRGNLTRHVETLQKKIDNVLKQRSEARLRRVASVAAQVYPRAGGKAAPQERMLGIHAFLPRYGFWLIERLLNDLPVPCWEHEIVIL
jgi:bacillithiol biosynthesis cysteine-adding enzyme BshC